MYKVLKEFDGKRITILKAGMPKFVILNDKADQKVLKFLFDQGFNGIENGSDNKKWSN